MLGSNLDIQLWQVPPSTEREDLTVRLRESGTGVGQVLAILYVVMTRAASTIVIDEPNSFLHPGAAKKLVQILRRHPKHQYVVATHSPDLISAINSETIHFVHWADGESRLSVIDARDVKQLRDLLSDVGATLSDVFGYDKLIWVEGKTEQECFPTIYRHRRGHLPLGLGFVAVRGVGDFESSRNDIGLIIETHRRLSQLSPIVPVSVAFSFATGRSAIRLPSHG
jgi:AAA domain, putative AbiEii toxin, Type IV TA system